MRQTKNPFSFAVCRLFKVLFYSDLHGTRLLLAIAELVWALTMFAPGNTFDRPTYTVMSEAMSESAWAFIFLMSSMTQFSIVLRMDYHSRFATYFAGWNSVLWWYVVIAMYLSVSPPPAAISCELALALGAGWVWCRSGLTPIGTRANDYGQH